MNGSRSTSASTPDAEGALNDEIFVTYALQIGASETTVTNVLFGIFLMFKLILVFFIPEEVSSPSLTHLVLPLPLRDPKLFLFGRILHGMMEMDGFLCLA